MAPVKLRTAVSTIGEPEDPCQDLRDALALKQDILAETLLSSPPPPEVLLQLQAEVQQAQEALDQCVGAKPKRPPVRIPSDLNQPRPTSVRDLIRACNPPHMSAWTNPERAFAENQDWTEELNGLVTDGHAWYASCNVGDEREGLYKLTMSFQFEDKITHGIDPDVVHIGALSVRGGEVFVPMQQEATGVWVVDTNLTAGRVYLADKLPDDDLFAWCDVNPHNGLIYTCNFTRPTCLYAYERVEGKLKRVGSPHDIPLHQPGDGQATTKVQSGCFTPNFKWLAVCDVDGNERIHCHSTLTGNFLDRRQLLAETDEGPWVRNELEGISYAPIHTGKGNLVQVHVLELNNEVGSADDMYLWQFSLHDPDAL
jgi:hypothetical protein